eukprot:m51a1_g13695 hypothetical protein (401) ;mRNA; r:30487-31894
MGRMSTMVAVAVVAAAAVANAEFYCYNNPNRGSDNVIPYSIGVGTVTTTVQSTSGSADWSAVSCFLYASYIASDAQGHPLTSTWGTTLTSQMVRSTAHGGNMFQGSLPLRNGSVLEVVSYCSSAQQSQYWCGGSQGNIMFRMPPVAAQRRSAAAAPAARSASFRVYTNPNANSDNVIPASTGVAILTSTIDGAVDLSTAQCFAWYGYVPATDDGHILSPAWGQAVSMAQTRILADGGNLFTAQIPLVIGHVLQATTYCVAGGQFVWAPSGNINFRLAPEQQHPTGSLSIDRTLSTPLGTTTVPASSTFFSVVIASRFQGAASPVAGSRCALRFGFPANFGGVWPTVNETLLAPAQGSGSADQWSGSVLLPAAGRLLEATARCTYNGIESWLGGNYQVQVY